MVENGPPDIMEVIKKELEKGMKGEGAAKFESSKWFNFFGFRTNPFEKGLIFEYVDLFCDRMTEVKYFSNLIGYQKQRREFYHVAIVSPTGRGKTTLLTTILTKLLQVELGVKGIVADFHDYVFLPDRSPIKSTSLLDPQFSENDFLFLVNCVPRQAINEWIARCIDLRKLVVTSWSPFQYDLAKRTLFLNADLSSPQKVIYLMPLEKSVQEDLIQRRVSLFGNKNCVNHDDLVDVLSFCKGNIRLLLALLEKGFRVAFAEGRNKVAKGDFARAISDFNLPSAEIELSSTELTLVRYIFDHVNQDIRVTPTGVARDLQWDTAQAWRYLKHLVNYHILDKKGYGKKAEYLIDDSYLSIAESYFMKNYLMQEKPAEGT